MNISINFQKEHETLIQNKNNTNKMYIFMCFMPYIHKMDMFNTTTSVLHLKFFLNRFKLFEVF